MIKEEDTVVSATCEAVVRTRDRKDCGCRHYLANVPKSKGGGGLDREEEEEEDNDL